MACDIRPYIWALALVCVFGFSTSWVLTPVTNWTQHYELQKETFDKIRAIDNELPPPAADIGLGLAIEIQNIMQIDEKRNTMKLRIRRELYWQDVRVRDVWPKDGLDYLYVDRGELWRPKVPVRNLANEVFVVYSGKLLLIAGGHMYQEDMIIIETGCKVDVEAFPYDQQICEIICNAVSAPDALWELKNASRLEVFKATPSQFIENAQWTITAVSMELKERNAIARVFVKRFLANPFFFLVIPALVITLVGFLQFALPLDGGERVGLGVTCMLSMVVFMTILDDKFSPDENRIPKLAWFFGLLMLLITITTALSTFCIQIYSLGEKKTPPQILRLVTGYMALAIFRKQSAHLLLESYREEREREAHKLEHKAKEGEKCEADCDAKKHEVVEVAAESQGAESPEDDHDGECHGDEDTTYEEVWKMIAITIDNYSLFLSMALLAVFCLIFLTPEEHDSRH